MYVIRSTINIAVNVWIFGNKANCDSSFLGHSSFRFSIRNEQRGDFLKQASRKSHLIFNLGGRDNEKKKGLPWLINFVY